MKKSPVTVVSLLLLGFAALNVSGCATVPEDPEERAAFEEINDPLEPMNRAFFDFNQGLDKYVIKPIAEGYVAVVPERGRRSLRNFLNNLRTPVIFANDVLQAEVTRAGITLGRFVVNSTLGVGGLFDVADEMGMPFHDEDFGQTLAVWGVPEGPYLVLPVLGPSNPRDAIGKAADAYMDPATYAAANNDVEWALFVRSFVDGIDERSRVLDVLDEIERTSLDFYATIRSLYRQRRADEIANGEISPEVPGPSILSEDGEIEEEPASDKASL